MIVVAQKFPRNASAMIGSRETRVDVDRLIEVIDSAPVVSRSLEGNAAIVIGKMIVRTEPYDLVEMGDGTTEVTSSTTVIADVKMDQCPQSSQHSTVSLCGGHHHPVNANGRNRRRAAIRPMAN